MLGISTGDPRLDHASVDLHVTAMSTGFGRQPFTLRVLGNGQLLDTRRIVPPADGSPIDELFTVSPDPLNPTVYTADIPRDESETVAENNARSVLVSPAGRKRRLLILEGAPGHEHSFVTRAWTADPGLEVDSVTRKGKNGDGQDTFFVQAGAGRSAALTSGFPAKREQLYAYDALVIANIEGRLLLARAARHGGRLRRRAWRRPARPRRPHLRAARPVRHAARGSAPVELNDRRGGLVRTSRDTGAMAAHNKLTVTAEGETHPVMRIGGTPDETRKMWSALPALAASAHARRPAARRDRPGVDDGAGRRRVSGGRGAALRTGPLDGVRGRGVVALEDDGRLLGSHL